jgi:hypothetical protein
MNESVSGHQGDYIMIGRKKNHKYIHATSGIRNGDHSMNVEVSDM